MFSLNRAAHVPCLLVAGLLCLASALPVVAQTAHEHEHTGPAVANLQLDGGQKWQTDAALRSGMAAIRSAFATRLLSSSGMPAENGPSAVRPSPAGSIVSVSAHVSETISASIR